MLLLQFEFQFCTTDGAEIDGKNVDKNSKFTSGSRILVLKLFISFNGRLQFVLNALDTLTESHHFVVLFPYFLFVFLLQAILLLPLRLHKQNSVLKNQKVL
jgi:hypothetical protein